LIYYGYSDLALQPEPKLFRCRDIDATEGKRFQLFSHAQAPPKVMQQDLAM